MNPKLAVVLVALSLSAFAKEKAVAEKDVPKPVTDAVKARYPTGTVSGYAMEKEGKTTSYEVRVKQDGREYETDFSAEGKLVSEEMEIEAADVPAEVRAAEEKSKYAKWKIERVEKVVLAGKEKTPSYEVLVTDGKKWMEVVFDHTGKLVKEEKHQEPHKGEAKREMEKK